AINVWDANFKGVWHLKENGGLALDSTVEDNDGTLYPTPVPISACDATDDWAGNDLSIDEVDKKEGTGSLEDASPGVPVALTTYSTTYDPDESWDWSDKKHILLWFKCDRADGAFDSARLYIYDTGDNWRYWTLTFAAGEWTAVKELLSTGDDESIAPPNLALIDYVQVRFVTADNTAFYKKIDYLRIDDKPQWVDGIVN
ncbi:unnamed protein product, partial [marine sediment metagenome]